MEEPVMTPGEMQTRILELEAELEQLSRRPTFVCDGCGRVSQNGWITVRVNHPFDPDEYDMECPNCNSREIEEDTASDLARLRDDFQADAEDFKATLEEISKTCKELGINTPTPKMDVKTLAENYARLQLLSKREAGWLIERHRDFTVQYLTMEKEQIAWTDSPDKAIRFARRQDAEAFAYGEECDAVVEHSWG